MAYFFGLVDQSTKNVHGAEISLKDKRAWIDVSTMPTENKQQTDAGIIPSVALLISHLDNPSTHLTRMNDYLETKQCTSS